MRRMAANLAGDYWMTTRRKCWHLVGSNDADQRGLADFVQIYLHPTCHTSQARVSPFLETTVVFAEQNCRPSQRISSSPYTPHSHCISIEGL